MITISNLPNELIQLILIKLDLNSILNCSKSNSIFRFNAQLTLLSLISLNSIKSIQKLLNFIELKDQTNNDQDRSISDSIKSLTVSCREHGTRGFSTSINRLLQKSNQLKRLEIIGIEDMRIKSLVGTGSLTELVIRSTTFKNHSLPFSPTLSIFCQSLKKLILSNLGLPSPSTHMIALLQHSINLKDLSLSSLLDLTPELFKDLLLIVQNQLEIIRIGSLSESQDEIFTLLLPGFSNLNMIEIIPTASHLSSLPSTLRILSVKRNRKAIADDSTAEVVEVALKLGQLDQLDKLILWKGIRGLRRIEALVEERDIVLCYYN